jgi:hypothetical protein
LVVEMVLLVKRVAPQELPGAVVVVVQEILVMLEVLDIRVA